ncbi:TRL-like family protein [bacterium]|nr:TRL-like family protein [bacterium]
MIPRDKHTALRAVALRGGLLALCVLMLNGCVFYNTPVRPYWGTGFNHTTFPVDIEFHGTQMGNRIGRSSSVAVLFGFISFGDASVMSAARNGQIVEISHIDAEMTNVLGLYVSYETIVSGFDERGMARKKPTYDHEDEEEDVTEPEATETPPERRLRAIE